jgi:ABC-type bacteriocin/lantibiotic exporter with double-glycine peptidase domain
MIKYDKKDGFGLSFMAAILSAMISFFVGLILSAIWSLVLCYFVPLLIISYAIFEYDKIISKVHDIKIKHNKKNKNIIKDVTNDIKAEELAKQAYENLKKDFPNIKYETVLENIKSKM